MRTKNKILPAILLFFITLFIFACSADKTLNQQTNTEAGISFWTGLVVVLLIIGVVALSIFVFRYIFPVGLWFKAWVAGIKIGPRSFFNMYIQKIPADLIVNNIIKAKKANLSLDIRKLENYYLAKIDIEKLVEQLIRAQNANVQITIDQLAKVALAKQNVSEFIDALILVNAAEINTNYDELMKYQLSGADIVRALKNKIETKNANFPVELKDIVEHILSGGNIEETIAAFIAAKKSNLPDVDFETVASIDLAGYKVTTVIQNAIIPRVVEGDKVRAIARDGVEVSMKLKVTLRAKLKYIVGNPDENTIVARINESLATEIGLAGSHLKVLESPFELADKVEKKGLDKGTAFEILSIDVSDISIGKNFQAILETEKAMADAQKAKVDLLKADEKLKKAIAAAFLDGKITVQEYEKLMNLQADTKMRVSISKDFENENIENINDDENEQEDEHKR
mgnify:CR=1 FL=1